MFQGGPDGQEPQEKGKQEGEKHLPFTSLWKAVFLAENMMKSVSAVLILSEK